MLSPRLLVSSAACAAALCLAGCNPCASGCNRRDFCADKFGSSVDVEECIDQCEASNCVNKDDMSSCYADMKCENSVNYLLELGSCASLCKTN